MEPFKNLLSADVAKSIGRSVACVYPEFDFDSYADQLNESIAPLELKARMHHIADRLMHHLPDSPENLFPILVQATQSQNAQCPGLSGFAVWPFTEIVARRGGDDAFQVSMLTLAELTKVFTAEFAIRPFLINHRDKTLAQLLAWTADPNEHVRRLASEGSRPLLPWGERLPDILANPKLTTDILDQLHHDPSEYVRRSVANHLNDFSRTHPNHVLDTLRRWKPGGHATFPKLLTRAARTLIKNGNPDALALMGYDTDARIDLVHFRVNPDTIPIGESITLEIKLKNPTSHSVQVLIDYAIHHLKANGKSTRKVFKGRTTCLPPHQSCEFTISHSFRPITTRKYYPGKHHAELVINGAGTTPYRFELKR